MAAGIKTSRVLLLSLALAAVVAVFGYAAISRRPPHVEEPVTCTPIPANIKVGSALTVAQVEAESLAEMQDAPPEIPRVPFGSMNSEWEALKRLMRPGDTVHEFTTEISGGHLVLRQKCVVGEITGWIR